MQSDTAQSKDKEIVVYAIQFPKILGGNSLNSREI